MIACGLSDWFWQVGRLHEKFLPQEDHKRGALINQIALVLQQGPLYASIFVGNGRLHA